MSNLPHCHGLAAAMRLQQLNDALQNKALSRARGAWGAEPLIQCHMSCWGTLKNVSLGFSWGHLSSQSLNLPPSNKRELAPTVDQQFCQPLPACKEDIVALQHCMHHGLLLTVQVVQRQFSCGNLGAPRCCTSGHGCSQEAFGGLPVECPGGWEEATKEKK